jgi:hypothetical protein
MAQSLTTLPTAIGTNVAEDTANDSSGHLNLDAAGDPTLNTVEIDNSANSHAVYTKFYNAAAPNVGTDAPDMILPTLAGDSTPYHWPDGLDSIFGTALSYATVKEPGTGGTGDPDSSVPVKVLYTT